ncbi:hypothetical protein LTR10_012668 [Elasticomyces elasticus]|uniref:Phosphogluconate dehydrogenase NAD-binding putative C-terminal domain-containing protein n=1 Tax=Exophiala sideris TaxID=1016849 RepID=A0ABR0JRC0_9EURO|nr:hypothetical protein LTR10_012668 [Elasticomyces elasticus]KAK5040132.1 hypothetical protein LTS07_000629 [Exophiala sideris]KAK5068510.1 hypothetical protein LTR69_000630 [Exophiala sideris]KAK5186108.1 hypothetical protein LTR44_001163 [Eurotiomycetes sp. CCFEE 6388]
MATSSSTKPAVGILSIGDMGVGISRLLRHHEYPVLTHTLDRIKSAQITALKTDEDLFAESDIILSIVPPRDALATGRRVYEASCSQTAIKRRQERSKASQNLTYIDMNAISPRTTKTIGALFGAIAPSSSADHALNSSGREAQQHIKVDFLDGGIIGGPPSLREDKSWKRPSIVISGPRHSDILSPELIDILNIKVIADTIGSASALKSCFAALSKGLIALSILSFTTAHSAGVLPFLEEHLKEFNPALLAPAKRGLTSMPPKAYRWVDEMREINQTFVDEGGFDPSVLLTDTERAERHANGVFEGIADIYKLIADDTVLGEEKTESRKRGKEVEDVVQCVSEGIAAKKRRIAGEGWRGTWV